MKRRFLHAASIVALTAIAAGSHPPVSAAAPRTDETTILHVLNRVAFGPRPGDIEKIRASGVQAYIDQQLEPERIGDPLVSARLAELRTLAMSSEELADQYERPAIEARRQRQQQSGSQAAAAQPRMPDPVQQRAQQPVVELGQQKVLRAVYTERQLQEVLVDFWFNHFNVDARKGPERFLLTEYERETIRPHVLGSFETLLRATAESPAMLFYLDNWMSADPNGPHPVAGQRGGFRGGSVRGSLGRGRLGQRFPAMPTPPPANQNARRGLNENYARELMELHTLGVDGGYTQKDVTEVARAFTGWTIQNPRMGGGFRFDPRIHDTGQKIVLGHIIKAGGGQSDGEQVLDILAKHPSTARFIARKLAVRFVSDAPPQALVDRAAARFTETGGNLREVVRTILTSPEFLAPEAYRAKVKTPFEFVVSALRATGADVQNAMPLVRGVQQLGMPLYMCQPPTGYKDSADAWVSTGALVSRMNFALQLASGRLNGTVVSVDGARIADGIMAGDVSDTTRSTIARATTPEQMVALTIGSPEFQRR